MVNLTGVARAINWYVDFYSAFIPTSKRKKEELFSLAREKVRYYQPRMEERTGVKMGKFKVKDLSEYPYDYSLNDIAHEVCRSGNNSSRRRIEMSHALQLTLARVPMEIIRLFLAPQAKYYDRAIYFPFGLMNRLENVSSRTREKNIDLIVVHELSHGLWDKINRNFNGGLEELDDKIVREFRSYNTWSEGFATYCHEVEFFDIYPEDVKANVSAKVGMTYPKARETVERAIAKYGKSILLEIPNRWRELHKEFGKIA